MTTQPAGAGPTYIQSLARGLAVIRCFDESSPQLTLSEVAKRASLTRATARRFLLTLTELGYVRTDGREFALSPRVLELGYSYLSSASLPQLAEPHLERLVAEVHESASVSVLDGVDIVYVARVAISRIMTVGITIGTRLPAYCTSMGRVLLANLPADRLDEYFAGAELRKRTPNTISAARRLRTELGRVRRNGWAFVDQELELGLRSAAVPLHDRSGRVVAAMNVSLPVQHGTWELARDTLIPAMQATAEQLDRDLSRVTLPHID
jgi:IclR family pca regulon transcriptional regulator